MNVFSIIFHIFVVDLKLRLAFRMKNSLSSERYCPRVIEILLENPMVKLADEEDRDEPDFRPKYKKVLPPGLGQRQTTSIGVGQSKGSNV